MFSRIATATVLIAALCTLMASRVRADTRVTVHDFYGPNATRVRDDVVNLLERQSGVTIVSQKQIEAAAIKLGVDPFSPDGRKVLSRELKLSAWMTGVVKKRQGKLTLTVVVYDGSQHSLVGRTSVSGTTASKLSSEIKGRLWQKSRRAIMHASSSRVSATAVAANASGSGAKVAALQAEDDEDPTKLEGPASAARTGAAARVSKSSTRDEGETASDNGNEGKPLGETLRAVLGLGSPYRSLSYREPLTKSLGDYQLSGAPMVDINVAFHPARLATDNWLSYIGLDLRAQVALSTPSHDNAGNDFKSRYDAFHIGLRARVPVGAHYISAFSGYAMNRFSISPENKGVTSPAPSVDYRTIRSGLGGELALSDSMMLGLDAAYLNYLSVGEIGKWFPRATAGGIEFAMFATYLVTPAIFARASAPYQRTFFDFNSRPGDKNIAGGATDQYLALSLGAGVTL